jgi:multiple sugar transport system permease protein
MALSVVARTELGGGRRATVRARRRRRHSAVGHRRRDRLTLLCLLAPAVLWLGLVQGYPLLNSLWVSFQDWSLAESTSPSGFTGLANYRKVLADPVFLHSLRLSAFVALSVPLQLALGFALAYFTLGESRLTRVARTALMVPMVIAPIAVGAIWRLVLDGSGPVNLILSGLGVDPVNWLGQPTTAQLAVIAIDVWEWVPFAMVIYVAALGSVSPELIGSARVDGASRWQIVRHVLLPLTLPATVLILIFRLIDAFLIIDVVYSLTGGGPGDSTDTATLYLYNQGLKYFNISQAAAGSWIITVICGVIAVALFKLRGRAERATL